MDCLSLSVQTNFGLGLESRASMCAKRPSPSRNHWKRIYVLDLTFLLWDTKVRRPAAACREFDISTKDTHAQRRQHASIIQLYSCPSKIISYSCQVMTCRAKHAPLENLRSCDRSMQLPSWADGCLAGDVYLDIFSSWCLVQSAGTYFILLKLMTCKYSHGLVVRLWDCNHSNLGSNHNRTQRSFAQKITLLRYHYYILLRGR